jgi:hypothetical protein
VRPWWAARSAGDHDFAARVDERGDNLLRLIPWWRPAARACRRCLRTPMVMAGLSAITVAERTTGVVSR